MEMDLLLASIINALAIDLEQWHLVLAKLPEERDGAEMSPSAVWSSRR